MDARKTNEGPAVAPRPERTDLNLRDEDRPYVLSVAMEKGGVGKTTTAINVAAALTGHYGLNVTVMDMDPQSDATRYLLNPNGAGVDPPTIYEVVSVPGSPREARRGTAFEGLSIIPGSKEMTKWEIKVPEEKLADVFQFLRGELRPALPDDVDLTIIDTPPSLGLWMQGSLAISDGVIVVAQPERFSWDKLEDVVETIHAIRTNVNPRLRLLGIVLNDVDTRTNEHRDYLAAFEEIEGEMLIAPTVPQRTVAKEATRFSEPIEFYKDPDHKAGELKAIYRDLAGEILRRAGLLITPDS